MSRLTQDQLEEIHKKTAGHCHWCGDELVSVEEGYGRGKHGPGAWEVDHVSQRKKGGPDSVANYLPICKSCNRSRCHRTRGELADLIHWGEIAQTEVRNPKSAIGKKLRLLSEKRAESTRDIERHALT